MISLAVESAEQVILKARAGSRQNLRPDLFLQLLVTRGVLDELAAADCAITRTRLWFDDQP